MTAGVDGPFLAAGIRVGEIVSWAFGAVIAIATALACTWLIRNEWRSGALTAADRLAAAGMGCTVAAQILSVLTVGRILPATDPVLSLNAAAFAFWAAAAGAIFFSNEG